MKNCFAVFLLLFLAHFAIAQAQPAKPDLHFQQSPARPAPDGIAIVDHGQFDPRLKGYFAPDGIKIDIVAEAPQVINPVGMSFDADGNLYVLEWAEGKSEKVLTEFTYKDGAKRKVLIMRKPAKDRVKMLSYNAKTGVYDAAKVVLEEEMPSSILIHDGWMYLSGQGTVRRYKKQADGSWGNKEIIAQGFCGYHHQQVSGLTIGNDGWLYITAGDNDNHVEGSDGSRATVLRTGAVFRCRPDGSKLHTHSIGYRNPYRDVAFDAAFNMFHVDGENDDGSKWTGCRLMHISEGADFGWRLRPGAECCIPDFVRGAVHGEAPGKLPPMLKTGRGAPAGLLIYNDTYFPDAYRGLLYYPDVFRKVVRAYRVKPAGATFEVTHEFEFLRSNDPLFRPSQMILGPDGAMYLCTNSGGDGKQGRIYRLSWKGTKEQPAIPLRGLDSWAKIAKQSDDDLLKTFDIDNFSDRLRAQQEVVRRGDKLREAILKADFESERARIAALGALQSFWNDDVKRYFIESLARGGDLARLAADGLALNCKKRDSDAHDALVRRLNEDDPAVRRAIFLAIGRIANANAGEVIVNGLQFDKRTDEVVTDGLVRALEHTGKDGITKLLTLADSGSDKDLDRAVEVFLALRNREAAEKIPVLLKHYHVSPEQKVALLRSYMTYQLDPPISVEPLVKFLDDLPVQPTKQITVTQLNAMRLAALDVLAGFGKVEPERWKTAVIAMLMTEDPKVRQAVLHTIADARLTSTVPILLDLLKAADNDAKKITLIRTLGQLHEGSAFGVVQPFSQAKNPMLRIETLRALSNIGYHPARKTAETLLADDALQVQREAVVILGRSIEGARIVGKRLVDKKLPRSLLPEVTESLRRFASNEHPDVVELLARVRAD